ncbi:MAG: SIR2 family protein [Planctomycetales bacterium]|nr:SIR2 family protein [Planctomycetales bacterium]
MPADEVALFRDNFEDGMNAVLQKFGMAVAPLMQEMAVFFSIFAIPASGENRYVTLLERARKHRVLWSTLNYECLLECAAARLGRSVAYFADPADDSVPVWKLHGSCNFRVTGLAAGRGVSFGTGVTVGGGIEPMDLPQVREWCAGDNALYPAMSLYAAGKPIVMSPGPVQDAQSRWARHVLESERVLLIGINPHGPDGHVWGPLATTPAEVACIGNEAAFTAWASANRGGRPTKFFGSRWSRSERAAADFLTA